MTALPFCSPAGETAAVRPGQTHCPITAPTSTPSLQRISLTRQQPSGTAGILGQTGKGGFPNWLGGQAWDGVQGCEGGKDSQWDVGRAVLLLCWGAGLHPCHAPQNSSFLKMQGAVPRPQGAGTGRDTRSRAGCWRAGTHPGTWEARRDAEGREESPRREAKQGVAPGSLVMHYWKHLAWDVEACTGCTHMCAQAHGFGETHTHICICEYMCISTCTHTCSHVPTYPYVCTYVPIRIQTHIHRHKCLHSHVDTPRRVCIGCVYTACVHSPYHIGINVQTCMHTCVCTYASKHIAAECTGMDTQVCDTHVCNRHPHNAHLHNRQSDFLSRACGHPAARDCHGTVPWQRVHTVCESSSVCENACVQGCVCAGARVPSGSLCVTIRPM